MTENLVDIGAVSDFPEGTMHPVEVAGEAVLLVHQNGQFYALADRCTHREYPLHTGELLEGAVKCEWHGAKFNLETGKPTIPAVKKIRLYETRVEGDRILVALQEV
jgi:3-phenylpropionate/trans-cinnamate dioxygenase ferredoxin subunit